MILSPEQIKEACIQTMGADLGGVFYELHNEVTWLQIKWSEYVVLYGTKPSRITLLNQAAPKFFGHLEIILFEETLLHIARLTDSTQTCGHDNLTINHLPFLTKSRPATFQSELKNLIDRAIEASEFCRDWRNKRIAHMDLNHALDAASSPLKTASRAKVNDAIQAIWDVLNQISKHYRKTEIGHGEGLGTDGAISLLYVLDDGIAMEKMRKERLEKGTFLPEDVRPKDL